MNLTIIEPRFPTKEYTLESLIQLLMTRTIFSNCCSSNLSRDIKESSFTTFFVLGSKQAVFSGDIFCKKRVRLGDWLHVRMAQMPMNTTWPSPNIIMPYYWNIPSRAVTKNRRVLGRQLTSSMIAIFLYLYSSTSLNDKRRTRQSIFI